MDVFVRRSAGELTWQFGIHSKQETPQVLKESNIALHRQDRWLGSGKDGQDATVTFIPLSEFGESLMQRIFCKHVLSTALVAFSFPMCRNAFAQGNPPTSPISPPVVATAIQIPAPPPVGTVTPRSTVDLLNDVEYEQVASMWTKYRLYEVYTTRPLDSRTNARPMPYFMPVFIRPGTNTTTSWTDWNRIGTGIGFTPSSDTGVRAYITVQSVGRRLREKVYMPKSNGHYDLSAPPVETVFNREMYTTYFDKVYRKSFINDIFDEGRFYWTFGFSPAGFKIGNLSSSPVTSDKVTYFIGGGYAINPYSNLIYGAATESGRSWKLTFGFSLDLGIIGNIFK